MRIALFIAEIDFAVGGTESYFAGLLKALQRIYPHAQFEVITTYMPPAEQNTPESLRLKLNELFGTDIQRPFTLCRIPYAMQGYFGMIYGNRWFKNYTRQFDICFNCTRNLLLSKAKKNYAIIHFPVRPYEDSRLAKKTD